MTADAIAHVADEVARTLEAVHRDAFDALVAELRVPGRTWFCTGQGRSGLVARMVAMRLVHLGRRAHVVGEATAPAIADADALLVLSASGETPLSRHYADTARDVGASVVLVTTRPASPLARTADTVLHVATSSSQFGGSLFEQSALLVLDAAVLALDEGDPPTRDAMARRHANLQ